MWYFWWGCRGNLTSTTLRSERVLHRPTPLGMFARHNGRDVKSAATTDFEAGGFNDESKGLFHTAPSRSFNVNPWPTQYLASIRTDWLALCICRTTKTLMVGSSFHFYQTHMRENMAKRVNSSTYPSSCRPGSRNIYQHSRILALWTWQRLRGFPCRLVREPTPSSLDTPVQQYTNARGGSHTSALGHTTPLFCVWRVYWRTPQDLHRSCHGCWFGTSHLDRTRWFSRGGAFSGAKTGRGMSPQTPCWKGSTLESCAGGEETLSPTRYQTFLSVCMRCEEGTFLLSAFFFPFPSTNTHQPGAPRNAYRSEPVKFNFNVNFTILEEFSAFNIRKACHYFL